MTCQLPSLEVLPVGLTCPVCGDEMRLEHFCPTCFERSLQASEAKVQAVLDQAKRRARTWQLHRALQADISMGGTK